MVKDKKPAGSRKTNRCGVRFPCGANDETCTFYVFELEGDKGKGKCVSYAGGRCLNVLAQRKALVASGVIDEDS